MKRAKILILCAIMWGLTMNLCAATLLLEKKPVDGQYKMAFVSEGKGAYPYPIKTDTINQLLARRFAILNGYRKLLDEIEALNPYLKEEDQLHKDGDRFIKGIVLEKAQAKEDAVYVDLAYYFLLDEKSYKKLRKGLRGMSITKVEALSDYFKRTQPAFEITADFWYKLLQFEKQFPSGQ